MTHHHARSRTTAARAPGTSRRLLPLVLLVLAGCAGGRPTPPEAFTLGGVLVSFSPPPRSWHRSTLAGDGYEGVRFGPGGAVRARIDVAVKDGAAPAPARRGEFDADSSRWRLVAEFDTTLAGRPARRIDYEWRSPGDTVFAGRDYYVVREGRLVRAGFLGLERDRRPFARLVATFALPDSLPATAPTGTR